MASASNSYGSVRSASLQCPDRLAWSQYLDSIVPGICDASQVPETLRIDLRNPGPRQRDVPCVLSNPFSGQASTGTLVDILTSLAGEGPRSSYEPTPPFAWYHTTLNEATFLADLLVVARVASSGTLSFGLLGLKAEPVSGHTLALL